MNGPSRCVAKVFEDKNVRVADIIGCRCAWMDARQNSPAICRGGGHTCWHIGDAVLCPAHARVLEAQLKDFR